MLSCKVDFFYNFVLIFFMVRSFEKKVRKIYLFIIIMYIICLNDGDNSIFVIKIIFYLVYRKY